MTRRVLAATALLSGLIVGELAAPELFTLGVSAALVIAPGINWVAIGRFRVKHQANPGIRSLQAAYYTLVVLAIASTTVALIGLVVLLRAAGLVSMVPRDVFLIAIAYSLLLITAPAIEWLIFRPAPDARLVDEWPKP